VILLCAVSASLFNETRSSGTSTAVLQASGLPTHESVVACGGGCRLQPAMATTSAQIKSVLKQFSRKPSFARNSCGVSFFALMLYQLSDKS
jgi:hypothetical protein